MKLCISPCKTAGISSSQHHLTAQTRELRGLVYGLGAALIWGGYIATTHLGMQSGLSAPDLAFLRYLVAGLVLLPWLLRHQPTSLAGVGWVRGAWLAALAGPPFVLIGASGFLYAPLAHSAVLQLGMVTLMGILLSALVTREPQGHWRLAGLIIMIAGLVITSGFGLTDGTPGVWKGDLLFMLAGTMWASFTVLQRRWAIHALAATASVSVLSGIVYTPVYLATEGLTALRSADLVALITQALVLGLLSGVIALFCFARTVEYLGPGRASLFPALSPAIAILAGIPLSGTSPSLGQICGLSVLSIGMFLAMRRPHTTLPHSTSHHN